MRIDRIVARAFGPFRDEVLDLAPGMTVVVGPNEAGKSSWHAALRLALTGMRRGRGRATAADAAISDRHRPWDDPDDWRVEALIGLDDGRRIEIQQDLAGKVACAARDIDLGRDVSAEILDGTPDASRWLGLDRDAFATTISVSQAQILSVSEAASQLQEQMQRAASTRGTDATAAQAIERLTEFRKEAIGADTVAAKGPLRAAKARLAAAGAALEEARRSHAEYLDRASRAEGAERRFAEAERALAVARWAETRASAELLAARARRAAELAARHPVAPPALAERDEVADGVAAALDAWDRRPPTPQLTGRTSAELQRQLSELPDEPVGDLAPHPSVLAAARELDLARESLTTIGDEPEVIGPAMASDRLRALARQLREAPPARPVPSAAPRRGRIVRPRLAVGLAALVLALVAGMAGIPLAAGALAAIGLLVAGSSLAGLAGSAEVAAESERPHAAALERARAEAAAAGLPSDPDALDSLADDAVRAERDLEERDRWQARQTLLADRCSAAAEQLRTALLQRDGPSIPDLDAALQGYRSACDARAALAASASLRGPLERELSARLQAEAAASAATAATGAAAQGLAHAATAAGLTGVGDDPIGIAESLRRWQGARAATLRAAESDLGEWRELEELLGDGSLADLADEASRRLRESEERAAQLPAQALATAPSQPGLTAAIAARTEEVATADRAWHELKGALETLAAGLPDVAAAEEEMRAAGEELRRIAALAETVDETLRLLRAAQERVHRDLAPILADAVRRWLPVISGGAYTDVSVDPADLGIGVKEARTGLWREAKLLSEGTREQIYLLLRVAMAEHLVTTGETAPLLLDEVTAQADGERRTGILEMLHELSRERQVILFSHDAEVAAWAADKLEAPRDRLVSLSPIHGPRHPPDDAPRTGRRVRAIAVRTDELAPLPGAPSEPSEPGVTSEPSEPEPATLS